MTATTASEWEKPIYRCFIDNIGLKKTVTDVKTNSGRDSDSRSNSLGDDHCELADWVHNDGIDPMIAEVQITKLPQSPPVAHHSPAMNIQVQSWNQKVHTAPFGVQVFDQQRLQQQFKDTDVSTDGKADPEGLDLIFWHEVDVLQFPCATPVKDWEWKY